MEGKSKEAPLCLIMLDATKTYRGSEVSLHSFLTSETDGGE
jgi:hypothetical protein